GFVAGLQAEQLETEGLFSDTEGEGGNVIKAAGEEAEELVAQADMAAQKIIDEARQKAEEIVAEANERADREHNKIYNEAKTQGYEEGRKQAERDNELIRGELDRTRRELNKDYDRRIAELEPEFIDTLTGIYEHIFNVDLQSHREILVYLIESTMHKVEDRSFLVHVSREDYPYVSMQKKQLTAALVSPGSSVEIVEDMTLTKMSASLKRRQEYLTVVWEHSFRSFRRSLSFCLMKNSSR
ncbi:MAG: hypothetical protein LUG83_06750, partial [Lachnospiraceae bacterium]|nr:hypothetical protein [Lachnospiraceae bacterium]